MLGRKEKQNDLLSELEKAAAVFKRGEKFPLSGIQNSHLKNLLQDINSGCEFAKNQVEQKVEELDFLKSVLHMGYWKMYIHNNNLYDPYNTIEMDASFIKLINYKENNHPKATLEMFINHIHPEDSRILEETILNCTRNIHQENSGYDCKYRLRIESGEYRWVHHFGNINWDANGNMTTMNAFIRDIHEQYIIEEEMSYMNTRYSLIHSVLTEAPWDMTIDRNAAEFFALTNKYWWSDQYRHILGFKDENDFPNELSSWTNLLHPDDFEQAQQDMVNYLKDYTGRSEYHSFFRMKNKQGEYSWFQSEGKALRDESGYPIRVAGTIRNIQKEKMKEQNAQELKQRIFELTSSISEMVTGIKSINEKAQNLAEMQEESSKSAKRVKKAADETKAISEFIRSIAEETNLLGLNAAIEAARAGEQGKGFGVVAEHVRKLATNSKEATVNIEESLKNMEGSITVILEQMNQLSDVIQSQQH